MIKSRNSRRAADAEDGAGETLDWRLMLIAVLVPLLVTILLFKLNVPLGKPDTFIYRYSPVEIVPRRLSALPWALVPAMLLGGGVWLAFAKAAARRRLGILLVICGCAGGVAWTYLAPPDFRYQHFFNMQSPAQDGAFLLEADYVRKLGVCNYLSEYTNRLQTPVERMKGTRVLSNPPATTLLAMATLELLEESPRLSQAALWLGADEELSPGTKVLVIEATGFSVVLMVAWLLAGPVLYLVFRRYLETPAALAATMLGLFSPLTLLFSPGKDPGQLLTVALPLWLWLIAWQRERIWPAVLAGVVCVAVCLVSLVHIWIGMVVLVASACAGSPNRPAQFWLKTVLPAACGGLGAIGLLVCLTGAGFFGIVWAVARGQAEVTRGPDAMPLLWQLLGVPIFILFMGAGLWVGGLWLTRSRQRDRESRFGLGLLIGSAAVMLLTVGFTNVETLRLWIPFTPLLLLGLVLQLREFRCCGRSAAARLAMLVFLQFIAAASQWSLMDARETETRLLMDSEQPARLFD